MFLTLTCIYKASLYMLKYSLKINPFFLYVFASNWSHYITNLEQIHWVWTLLLLKKQITKKREKKSRLKFIMRNLGDGLWRCCACFVCRNSKFHPWNQWSPGCYQKQPLNTTKCGHKITTNGVQYDKNSQSVSSC